MALKIGEYEVTMSADGENFSTRVGGVFLKSTSMAALKKKVAAEEAKTAKAAEFVPVALIHWSGGISHRDEYARRIEKQKQAIAPPRRAWITGIEVKPVKSRYYGTREEVTLLVSYDTPNSPRPTTHDPGAMYPYSDELFARLTAFAAEMSAQIDRLDDARSEGQIGSVRAYCQQQQPDAAA